MSMREYKEKEKKKQPKTPSQFPIQKIETATKRRSKGQIWNP